MRKSLSTRDALVCAAFSAVIGGCGAEPGQPSTETEPVEQPFRTNPVLGTLGLNSSGVLATIQSATDGQILGGWRLSLNDQVQGPAMTGDFDADGLDDFVIRSGWGIGVIGNTSSDALTSKALTQFGTNIGLGWTLDASDQVVAVGKFGATSNPAAMVLKGSTGFAWVRASGGALSAITVVPYGTALWDSAHEVAWIVSSADTIRGVGRFDAAADELVVTRGITPSSVDPGWGWSIWKPGFASAAPSLLHIAPNGESFGGWVLDTNDPRLKIAGIGDLDNGSDGRQELVAVGAAGLVVLHKKSTGAWGTASMDTRFFLKDGFNFGGTGQTAVGTLHWLARMTNVGGASQRELLFQTQTGIIALEKSSTSWTFNSIARNDYGATIGSWTLGGDDVLMPLSGNFDNSGPNDFVITSKTQVGFLTVSGTAFTTLGKAGFSSLAFDEPERMIGVGKFDHSGKAQVLFKNIRPPVQPTGPAVLTYHNDIGRTGLNSMETALSATNVQQQGMTLERKILFTTPPPPNRGDIVTTQTLYAPSVTIGGVTANAIFITTANNELFVFDPDSGSQLDRHVFDDLEDPGARPVAQGIMSTPVIDYASKTIYLVMGTANAGEPAGGGDDPNFHRVYFVVAYDFQNRAVSRWVKIRGSYPRSDGRSVVFKGEDHFQRPALLLNKGSIYVAFGSRGHEEAIPYHGWLFRYDADTFEQLGGFCTSPNEWICTTAADCTNGAPCNPEGYCSGGFPARGAGIWGGGAGVVGDSRGQVYVATGNGPVDPSRGTYGDYFLKLGPRGYTLQLRKASPGEATTGKLYDRDWDLGGGAPLLLESQNRLIGGGKEGKYYVLDANTFATVQTPLQAFKNVYHPNWPTEPAWTGDWWWGSPHLHGQPVFWNGLLYQLAELDYLRAHRLSSGTLSTPSPAIVGTDRRLSPYGTYMRTQLSASSNGTTAGSAVIWTTLEAIDDDQFRLDPRVGCRGGGTVISRVTAYKAEDLTCLWSETVTQIGKHLPPTVAGGKLIIVTPSPVATDTLQARVYHLGGGATGCPSPPLPSWDPPLDPPCQ